MVSKLKKFKVTVRMKKPWILLTKWLKKPDSIDVYETFVDEMDRLTAKEFNDYFEITIEEEK